MFDPTIFDNVKVVMEGAVYDKDLDGVLNVIDRKDFVNLAEMSRHYSISFAIYDHPSSYCKWQLSSDVRQLSNEILRPYDKSEQGCLTSIEFSILVTMNEQEWKGIEEIISNHWKGRNISLEIRIPYPLEENVRLHATVHFDRIIMEEDIDDLVEMLTFMLNTLHSLREHGY
ncbi:hypothetical protein ACFSCX_18060 [Bacillus salitolerans]|uniref:Uncharacterized protein n=1 Tax=Bacillus salitolerans TaxID=1437434 RepID=A0ABW4LVD1_9BACI